MRSILSVTTPAANLALLTVAELRAAAGVTGTGEDAALVALGLRVASSIASECSVAAGRDGEPTLLQETLTETIYGAHGEQIILARRHNVEIVSVTADGTVMDPSEYETDPEAGLLLRLCNGLPVKWCFSKVVVVYKAGFLPSAIPGDLKQAAMDFVAFAYRESQRDPALKSIEVDIPDVERTKRDFWVGSVPGQTSEGVVPDVVAGQLRRYRNYVIG